MLQLNLLGNKAKKASEEELSQNPRARSARLRAVEKPYDSHGAGDARRQRSSKRAHSSYLCK